MLVWVSGFHEVGLLYKGSRYSLDLFKKKKKFKEKEKSAGGVFDFHLTKPIFVGSNEGDVRHDVWPNWLCLTLMIVLCLTNSSMQTC